MVAVVLDDDDAEVGTDFVGAREEFEDLRGSGGGGDVVVFGGVSEEGIADAAAGEEGGVAGAVDDGGEFGGGLERGHGFWMRGFKPRISRISRMKRFLPRIDANLRE